MVGVAESLGPLAFRPSIQQSNAYTLGSGRLQAQLLVILDQVAHCVVDMTSGIQIVSSYDPKSAPLTILFLVVIAAVEVAQPSRNTLP